MTAKRFVVSIDFTRDRKLPYVLRRNCPVLADGRSGILGAVNPSRRTVFIDVGAVFDAASALGESSLEMLMRTIDHEYAHAFAPSGKTSRREEKMALAFEAKGVWARGN